MDNITPKTLNNFRVGSITGRSGNLRTVAYSPKLDRFVIGGFTTAPAYYSSNGNTWTAGVTNISAISICWSPRLSIFCSVPFSGGTSISTSTDGITWSTSTGISFSGESICWSEELGIFCAVGGNVIQTSPDGITWTSRTPPDARTHAQVIWAAQLGLFITASNQFLSNRITTSPDGINWTIRNTPTQQLSAVAYSPYLNLAVAIFAAGGVITNYFTSPDGINWTLQTTLPGVISWRRMIWVPWLYAFVICGNNNIAYSFDGLNWTTITLPGSGTLAIAIAFNDSSLVILHENPSQNPLYTLPQPLLAQNGIPTPFNLGGTGVSTIGTSGQYAIVNAGATGLTYTTGPGGGGVSQVGLAGSISANSRKRCNELVPHNHIQFKQPNHCSRHLHSFNECFPNNHREHDYNWISRRDYSKFQQSNSLTICPNRRF